MIVMKLSFPATTPLRAIADHCSPDDVCDDDSYFLQTYVPLSNLPTPPLSSHSDKCPRELPSKLSIDERLNSTLLGTSHGLVTFLCSVFAHFLTPTLGPAIHLRNLIPSSTSLIDPSVQIVHSILARADLPLPTIALAVCILDSLNSRFARLWRGSCPLQGPDSTVPQQSHIDSIRPEVIILAALTLSVKFLDDQESTTKACCDGWGSGRWTCEQLNATQHCIMQNLGYRILPLWKEELIDGALEDMETAGRYASGFMINNPLQMIEVKSVIMGSSEEERLPGKETTPALKPLSENMHETLDVALETRPAFEMNYENEYQQLLTPEGLGMEFVPVYTAAALA